MIAKWNKHCPYADEEQTARRQAWRKARPRRSAKEIERKVIEMVLHASWLQGYTAVEEHLQEAKPKDRQ